MPSPATDPEEIGPTAEGRTMIAAFISSEANIRKLDHYRGPLPGDDLPPPTWS